MLQNEAKLALGSAGPWLLKPWIPRQLHITWLLWCGLPFQHIGAGGRRVIVQDHPQPHNKFKTSLGYIRLCFKMKQKWVL